MFPVKKWRACMRASITNSAPFEKELVLEYLALSGFPKSAESFQKESRLVSSEASILLGSVTQRLYICQQVLAGNIEQAVIDLNNFNPEILDCHPDLCFELKLQSFLEKIRVGDVQKSLFVAREFAHLDKAFMPRIEEALTLLAFPIDEDGCCSPACPAAGLLSKSRNRKLAATINALMLEAVGCRDTQRLTRLLKFTLYLEGKSRKETPKMGVQGLGSASFKRT